MKKIFRIRFGSGRVLNPLKALLLQGITPERIAMSLAIGAVISVLPVLGLGTILCTVVALGLRLNLVAIQVANWVAYPAQLLLLIPFFSMGATLFRQPPVNLAPQDLVAMFNANFWGSLFALWTTTWQGCVARFALSPVLVALLYLVLLPLLRKLPLHRKEAAA